MSMGGAATAQPLDISGAMQWNPATLSTFEGSILKFDIGMFKGTPTLYSSFPFSTLNPGLPDVSGQTDSELGYAPMPALAFAWGKAESKHKFGVSAFGISGFGVDYPEEMNTLFDNTGGLNPYFNPAENSNQIVYPQQATGLGHIESSYMVMQVGFTWSYQISDKLSIGVQPTINHETLELSPNPLATPTAGYPKGDKASAIGYGGQVGVFYDTQKGFKFGASYKSPQYFEEFEFNNTYLDGSEETNNFTLDYPAIYSIGLGYSKSNFDLAIDYRHVAYSSTEGFEKSGWSNSGSVQGFGWEDMSMVSVGLQYKGINKLPLRIGYTYSTNPIKDELAMFSVLATTMVSNAYQLGFSYEVSESFKLDGVYHYGTSDGKTSGNILNPSMVTAGNPLGKISGSEVAYDMETSMFQIGVSYIFGK